MLSLSVGGGGGSYTVVGSHGAINASYDIFNAFRYATSRRTLVSSV
jgi:hypothetical protein